MFTFDKKEVDKTTLLFTISVPYADINKRYSVHEKDIAGNIHVEGFRKGKAPLKIAKKNISKEKVYDELLKKLLEDMYTELITKYSLKPVISPKVDLKKAKEGEDWIIEMTIALKPIIEVPDYKNIIKDLNAAQKKDDIWVPGKDKEKKEEDVKKRDARLQMILNKLLDNTKIHISNLIIEHEVSMRLAQLLDDVKKIGLTMETYLKSKNITKEDVKKQYEKEISDVYKLEFLLQEIGDKENISIDNAEIEAFLKSAKDEGERKKAQENMYFYSGVLRKQKIINYLLDL